MEIKKIKISTTIAILLMIAINSNLHSQKHDIPRVGFMVSTATIQYGIPTYELTTPTWYLTIRGEGFIEKNISLAANIDISMPKKERYDDISNNYSCTFGVNYHLIKEHFDGFVGFQPGVAFTKTKIVDYNLQDKNKYITSPLMSTTIGARYYLGWVAHVFTSATYVYGVQLSNQTNLPLSEVRIAAGVGLNLNTMKFKD